MNANQIYVSLLKDLMRDGTHEETRCGPALSLWDTPALLFYETPLVTLRKTAWRKALREMEWFLSGDTPCPIELLDWWDGQLSKDGRYRGGYGAQLRGGLWDQVRAVQYWLTKKRNDRRMVMSTWNSEDMASIKRLNQNEDTPATCHGTLIQLHCVGGALNMSHYQRSADILLGVPHNWIQYWALLVWFARHAGLKVGKLRWMFGDLHLYLHETHASAAQEIVGAEGVDDRMGPDLIYEPTSAEFLADDFTIEGYIPDPVTVIRPKLLKGSSK